MIPPKNVFKKSLKMLCSLFFLHTFANTLHFIIILTQKRHEQDKKYSIATSTCCPHPCCGAHRFLGHSHQSFWQRFVEWRQSDSAHLWRVCVYRLIHGHLSRAVENSSIGVSCLKYALAIRRIWLIVLSFKKMELSFCNCPSTNGIISLSSFLPLHISKLFSINCGTDESSFEKEKKHIDCTATQLNRSA